MQRLSFWRRKTSKAPEEPPIHPSDVVTDEQDQIDTLSALPADEVLLETEKILNRVVGPLDETDETAETDELSKNADSIIKDYCIKVAIGSSAANAASLIPGIGTAAGFLFGVAATAGLVSKLQSDLIRDISAVYDIQLDRDSQEKIGALIRGTNQAGLLANGMAVAAAKEYGEVAVRQMGTEVAKKGSAKFAGIIPLIGPVIAASASMTTTYIVGKRAKKYFAEHRRHLNEMEQLRELDTEGNPRLVEVKLESWDESVKLLTGVDKEILTVYLKSAMTKSSANMKAAVTKVVSAAKIVRNINNPLRKKQNMLPVPAMPDADTVDEAEI